MASKEFKPGDLVFELDFHGGIHLEVLKSNPNSSLDFHKLTTRYGSNYSQCGRAYSRFKVPHLLHATPENRQALVTLFSEDEVPKIPLSGSELCKAMLARGDTRIMCIVSDEGSRDDVTHVIRVYENGRFHTKANSWKYAVPINNHGEPLTASEVGL